MRPILHLSLPVRDIEEAREFYVRALGCQPARARDDFVDVWFFGLQLTLHDRPDEATGPVPGSSRHFGVTLGRAEFDQLVEHLERSGVHWVSPVTTTVTAPATRGVDPGSVAACHGLGVRVGRDLESGLDVAVRLDLDHIAARVDDLGFCLLCP